MAAETTTPPAAAPEDQANRVPRWLVVTAALVLAGVVGVVVYGYLARPGWVGVADKKFWDYLGLLIVPAAIAAGIAMINWMQTARQRKADEVQQERERKAEEDRTGRELALQNQRAQDEALQAYLDQLTHLLVTQRDDALIRRRVDDDVRQVIQARSEPLLRSLNPSGRWSLILFLSVMGLLAKDRPLVSLAGADLRGVDGRGVPLRAVDLGEANLSEANLGAADLSRASLSRANLREAFLSGADLEGADLGEANLEGADLTRARLEDANLFAANLRGAMLRGASLESAILQRADLEGATIDDVIFIPGEALAKGSPANLEGADLVNASLKGVDLRWVKGLTQEQVNQATGDKHTQLPSSLLKPPEWKNAGESPREERSSST